MAKILPPAAPAAVPKFGPAVPIFKIFSGVVGLFRSIQPSKMRATHVLVFAAVLHGAPEGARAPRGDFFSSL